ncbi:MAG: hypothetical protein KBD07_05990, partial [Candidatus Omnitrophica bacterium]|nr:hypothetical protein [Candidatus Omnitrophota bacterium]
MKMTRLASTILLAVLGAAAVTAPSLLSGFAWAGEREDFVVVSKTFDDHLYELARSSAADFVAKYPNSPDASRANF